MTYHPHLHHGLSRLLHAVLFSEGLLLSALLAVSHAQVSLDGSLGPKGPLTGPHYQLGAELGQIRGGNLFHSFGEFNVPTGGSATFTGPHTIANIVGRVTGGQQSVIDGLLQSKIDGANLFLLNPSGVMFGPNASLDVSGSFHVSTADFLRFADGATFSARLGEESVLTVATPTAFGFLGSDPAAMTIQGSALRVSRGQALSLVGGEVQIVGGLLVAPSGRLQLASVASPGEVRFSPLELAPDLQVDGFARLGRIELSQSALVEASGDGGGMVLLRGGSLLVDRASIRADTQGGVHGASLGVDLWVTGEALLRNDAIISTTAHASGNAGRLHLVASELHLDSGRIEAGTRGDGDAGTIGIQAGRLTLTNGGQVRNATGTADLTEGRGRAGDVTVVATEAISISGRHREDNPGGFDENRSGLFSSTFSRGNAGRMVISTPTLRMDESIIRADAFSRSRGNAGDTEVRVERLTLTGGSRINNSTRGTGRAGQMTVVATEEISITGRSKVPSEGASGLVNGGDRGRGGRLLIRTPTLRMNDGEITGRTTGNADAGEVEVWAERLTLTGGGRIASSTGNRPPNPDPGGRGRGGTVTVKADTVTIVGRRDPNNPSGLFAESFGPGQGGTLQVEANHIQLRDGGTIEAISTHQGVAGTVRLQVGETFRSEGGAVTTQSAQAGGGRIELHARRLVQPFGSEFTTTVQGGGGYAGNLSLNAPFVVLDGNRLIANAFEGMGGNIHIEAGVFLAEPASLVSASSALGIQGTVDIRAPVSSLSGILAPLPQALVSAAALLPARFAARAPGGAYSSLVLGAREGLPLGPGALLPNPLVLDLGWGRTRQGPGIPTCRSPRIGLRSWPAMTRTWRGCGGDQHGRAPAALDRGVRQVTAGKATSSKHTRGSDDIPRTWEDTPSVIRRGKKR